MDQHFPPPNPVSPKTPQLTTIGYEGASLDAFLATLKGARVTHLLDVRELPGSRRKGFSKTPLSAALETAGIHYQHERALGTPRQMRHRFREHGDLARYFAEFRQHLAQQDAVFERLIPTLHGHVALMCFERNPAECHRSIVVAELAERMATSFTHLTVPPERDA
jgi:uncharacterized protein (DUF488 family)